jgi:hypothetical protein
MLSEWGFYVIFLDCAVEVLSMEFGLSCRLAFLVSDAGLVASLGASLTLQWPFRHGRWKKKYWLVFTSYIFIPLTLAIGVIAAVNPQMVPRPKPNTLAVWTSNGLFVASLLLGIYWAYRMKGLRWFAAAIALIQLWILFFAGFIAGMALSGDWL